MITTPAWLNIADKLPTQEELLLRIAINSTSLSVDKKHEKYEMQFIPSTLILYRITSNLQLLNLQISLVISEQDELFKLLNNFFTGRR